MKPDPASQARHCFGFESDLIGNWRCIPLCLRRKLDLAGIKLRLSHWLALSPEQRRELVLWPDGPEALPGLAERIRGLTRPLPDGEARTLVPVSGEPWQEGAVLPEVVRESALGLGQAISQQQWGMLTELERFALCKLARPAHDHHNLPAALSELLG